jgi:Ohr subfamily peroxiredoxin
MTGGDAAHGRASGAARSDDGNLDVALRLPATLGGLGGGTNPEQLFATGYAACFHGAPSLLAAKAGFAIPDSKVGTSVTFGRDPVDRLFMLKADITIRLPGIDRAGGSARAPHRALLPVREDGAAGHRQYCFTGYLTPRFVTPNSSASPSRIPRYLVIRPHGLLITPAQKEIGSYHPQAEEAKCKLQISRRSNDRRFARCRYGSCRSWR